MSTDLRTRLIRLAHAQPALRPHLLPLLKMAAPVSRSASGSPRPFDKTDWYSNSGAERFEGPGPDSSADRQPLAQEVEFPRPVFLATGDGEEILVKEISLVGDRAGVQVIAWRVEPEGEGEIFVLQKRVRDQGEAARLMAAAVRSFARGDAGPYEHVGAA